MTNEIALTLLPAFTAIAGVVIGQFLQMISKKIELKHQIDTDMKKLKRECLEKMFIGLREIDTNRRLIFSTYVQVYENEKNKKDADQFINDECSTNNDFFIYGEIYFPELFEKCFKDISRLRSDIESKTRYCSNFDQNNFRSLFKTMEEWKEAIENSKISIRNEINRL